MRSRLAPIGSRWATTTNSGAGTSLSAESGPDIWGSEDPMGTPFSRAIASKLADAAVPSGNPQPANKLTTILGPEVAKVSRRCMASNSASRVFSGAHTAARPPEPHLRAGVILSRPKPAAPVLNPAEPSIMGSLPVYPFSSLGEVALWLSLEPITPNFNGLKPSLCAMEIPLRSASRA